MRFAAHEMRSPEGARPGYGSLYSLCAEREGRAKTARLFFPQSIQTELRIHVVQELMGHADVKTTEIYTHVMEKDISAVPSPLDRLLKTDT
jgi:integrase